MLYKIFRPLIRLITIVFLRPKYVGLENIPKEGNIILAGNHIHNLDGFVVISSTKRKVHFLAKKELWDGPKKIVFDNMELIPVDRSKKDHSVLVNAEAYLKKKEVIGIFPEGTTEKGRGLLPFKIGAVKMASDTNTKIVPFVIKGKYKLFSKSLKVIFVKPIKINKDDLALENEKLRNIIKEMLEDD